VGAGPHIALVSLAPFQQRLPHSSKNRDEWGSLFHGDAIKNKTQNVWASPRKKHSPFHNSM